MPEVCRSHLHHCRSL